MILCIALLSGAFVPNNARAADPDPCKGLESYKAVSCYQDEEIKALKRVQFYTFWQGVCVGAMAGVTIMTGVAMKIFNSAGGALIVPMEIIKKQQIYGGSKDNGATLEKKKGEKSEYLATASDPEAGTKSSSTNGEIDYGTPGGESGTVKAL